jgi:serine/threonine protein kinase
MLPTLPNGPQESLEDLSPSPADPVANKAPVPTVGPYVLLETIGRGGMGTVYRARHGNTGQNVAIKVMTAEAALNPLLTKRFEQECAAANRLRHPHLVQGLALGVENGKLYLVMEFIEGQSLGQRINLQGPLHQNEAIQILVQIAAALHLAHGHQMIHRDVKPDNILVIRDGTAKLTDLGLIKNLGSNSDLTWARTSLGTVAYAAPEQFEDAGKADVRCDIYGLGATLYHALTGTAPFRGRIPAAILRKKLQNQFTPPIQLVTSLPRQVDEAICRALDACPEKRQNSCAEFVATLLDASGAWGGTIGNQPQLADLPLEAGRPQTVGSRPSEEERRRAFRFPSTLEASCSLLRDPSKLWRGTVQDISLTGIRLELPRRFELGSALAVELLDDQAQQVASLSAKVCWVRKQDARTWAFGCAFSYELKAEELDMLLGNLPKTVFSH